MRTVYVGTGAPAEMLEAEMLEAEMLEAEMLEAELLGYRLGGEPDTVDASSWLGQLVLLQTNQTTWSENSTCSRQTLPLC